MSFPKITIEGTANGAVVTFENDYQDYSINL